MTDVSKLRQGGFPRVVKRLDLSEFADELLAAGIEAGSAEAVRELLADNYVQVWLNHNGEFLDLWERYRQAVLATEQALTGEDADDLKRKIAEANALQLESYAALWGCSVEDVTAIREVSAELFSWASRKSWEFVEEYRQLRGKGARR